MSVKLPHTLYLCYFGLREPLVQSQVLQYLREIKKGGIKVSLLTFETEPEKNWTQEQINEMRSQLASEGIDWDFLTYHKRPSAPATLYDVFCGAIYTWRKVRKEKIDVLHGRVHIPTMMALLAKKFSFGKKPKVLFDIRGFLPEEYTEGGNWTPDGKLFRAVKRVEKWLLRDSDGFVVLTEKARDILFPDSKETGFDSKNRPVEVIPCCVDVEKFAAVDAAAGTEMRKRLNVENRRVIVYVGSFGSKWYLPDETADLLGEAKKQRPETYAMILTQTSPDFIKPLLEAKGFTEKDYFIQKVAPSEIPKYLSAADAAISFIKPCYSKLASSPTKNAEYLACGLPMITNSGVGDTAEFTRDDQVGYVLDEFNTESYRTALSEIEKLSINKPELAAKCKDSAKNRFDLATVGGERYRRIYQRLLK